MSRSRRKKKQRNSPIHEKPVPVHLMGLSVGMLGLVAMLTQVGTALGLLVFVPLGDSRDRGALLTALLSGACIALCGVATARNLIWVSIASSAVGACGAAVHVIVPLPPNWLRKIAAGKYGIAAFAMLALPEP